MIKLLALSALCASLVMAADVAPADPVLTAPERAAARALRSQVFPAEIQVKSGCYQDMNANKIGEYLFIEQLAGRAATNRMAAHNMTMLKGALADNRVADGYRFAVILPGGDQGLIMEADPLPVLPQSGAADREKFFAAIAWPVAQVPGGHVFLLMPDGAIRYAESDGTAPDAGKAIAYDAVKGTWTSPWQAIPVAELIKVQSPEPEKTGAGF